MEILNCKKLDETIKSFDIKGVKVYIMEKTDFSNISASFVVKYGSNDVFFKSKNDDGFKNYPLGIAHFLEHKMFDGIGNEDVFKKFSDIGSDVNAYTSSNITNYYFNTVNNFEKSLEYLCDMIYKFKLTDESVENEKLIIDQEIKMYDDDPYNRVYRNLLLTMYDKHTVRNDIAGDTKSIKLITRKHLEDCYNSFYVNNNMFIVIVGNVNSENIKILLEKFIVDKIKDDIVVEKNNGFDELINHKIEENMNMNVSTHMLGFKDMLFSSNHTRKLIIFELINRLYFRATSDFYNEAYKREIIDNSYSIDYTYEGEYGHNIITGDGEKFNEFPEFLFEYYSKYDFSKDRESLERVKKAIYGSYINAFNGIDNISHIMVKFIRHDMNPFNYLDELQSITLEEIVLEFKRMFRRSNMVHSSIV